MQHLIHMIVQIGGYLANFVSSRNINFSPRRLRLNDWFLYWKKEKKELSKIHVYSMGPEHPFFFGTQKKWRKSWINQQKIELQLHINTQSVDNFVVHYVKIKYFRVKFKRRAPFGPKPLKYDIKFYYEFCEKNVFKTYTDRFRIKN
jgi:hypothetical protein